MRRKRILPRLAVTGVIKNGIVYFPYLCAGIFSVFIWFAFSSILYNDLMDTLPHADYIKILMQIGRVLLCVILIPFLFYANNYLIKRRKKEIGLYSILGMEKRHIGKIMLYETIFICIIALVGGVLIGIIFSKLIFLLLMNISGLPVNVEFVFSERALRETVYFFLVVYAINLLTNIITVKQSNPIDLLGSGKKGEKEPKHLLLYTLLGSVALAGGYYLAVTTEMGIYIFTNFFLAVFGVVVGTYFLFTSGSVTFLKMLKKNKKFFYRSENFIVLSGMLYRMKKNAASLANICIFSTMVIITLTCTVSLYAGLDKILDFVYPYDINIEFAEDTMSPETLKSYMDELQEIYDANVTNIAYYKEQWQPMLWNEEEKSFTASQNTYGENLYTFCFLSLEDYNRMARETKVLKENEILLFSTGPDFPFEEIQINENIYHVREQLQEFEMVSKHQENKYRFKYYIIYQEQNFHNLGERAIDAMYLKLEGKETEREFFVHDLYQFSAMQSGFTGFSNQMENREGLKTLYGGLLFIGLFFSIIFIMCLLLIMYYKQISEGYEDQGGFGIMQQVGMSEGEIRHTIKRQILLVFFLPLIGAIFHMTAGMAMVQELFGVVNFYDKMLIMICGVVVAVIFSAFYGICYQITAKTYYKIVRIKSL